VKRYPKTLFFLGVVLGLVLASIFGDDIDSAEIEAQRYCQMVYEGNWPDFNNNYDQFCDGPNWNGK